jgi:hypothetical protein
VFTNNFSRPSKKTLLIVLMVATVTILLSSALSIWLNEVTDLYIPSIGNVKTIGVEAYWDENIENKTEAINWDLIWLGSSKNVTLYLRSASNVETVLQLNTSNWNPKNISKYMILTWNYNGTPVQPSKVIHVSPPFKTLHRVRISQ